MALTTDIETPAQEMSPELREALGIEFPSISVRGINCALGPKDDGNFYERRYLYDIDISFKDHASRDAFLNSPTISDDATTIAKTAESALQEPFDLEGDRDASDFYVPENPDEATMIAGITSGTQYDIEASLENDIKPIILSTFPDAGIHDIRINNIRGSDAMCYPAMPGDTIGSLIEDPAQEQQRVAQPLGRTMSLGL